MTCSEMMPSGKKRERRKVMKMMMMVVEDSTQHTRDVSPHWSVIVILWKEP